MAGTLFSTPCTLCGFRGECEPAEMTLLLASSGAPVSYVFPCKLCAKWNEHAATVEALRLIFGVEGWQTADAHTFGCRHGDPVVTANPLGLTAADVDETCAAFAAGMDVHIRDLLTPRYQSDPDA